MLRENATAIALTLAEKFIANGVRLDVLPNTPLASLMGATDRTPIAVVDVSNPQYKEVLSEVVRSTNFLPENVFNGTPHDEVQRAAVLMGARGVANHTLVIRTMVIPAIKELYDAVRQMLQDTTASSLLKFEIQYYDLPLPLRSPAMLDLINKYDHVEFDSKRFEREGVKSGDVDTDKLFSLLKTGLSVDKDLEIWINQLGAEWFLYVWKKFFQSNSHAHFGHKDDPDLKNNEALSVFLIARRLADEGPVEGTEMRHSDWLMRVKVLRSQAAAYLLQTLENWKLMNKRQVIVRSTGQNTVVVNEPVYRKWVESCASQNIEPNEVLFGNLILGRRLLTVKEFDQNALELQQAWIKYVGRTSVVERSSRLIQVKRYFERAFRQSIKDIVEADEIQRIGNYSREEVLKRFKAELETLKEKDLDDLHDAAMRLVCRSRFPHVDAESFIDDVQLIQKDHPTLSIREVTAIAAMNYVARWVCSMMVVRAL